MTGRRSPAAPRTSRSRRLLLAGLLAAVLLAAGCASAEEASVAAGEAGEAGGGPRLEASVLRGEATTITGDRFDLATLAGQDLVVWFWAPW